MDCEQHYRLKHGNIKAFRELYDIELSRAWFMCYHTTGDVCTGAPMLVGVVKKVMEKIMTLKEAPAESIGSMISKAIYQLSSADIQSDDNFESMVPPSIGNEFLPFVHAIESMEKRERLIYLLSSVGGLNANDISELTGKSFDEAKRMTLDATSTMQGYSEVKALDVRKSMLLFAQLKDPTGKPFHGMIIPQFLLTTLEREYKDIMGEHGKNVKIRKEGNGSNNMNRDNMNKASSAKKKEKKNTKLIVAIVLVAAIVISCAFVLPNMINKGASTRIVTYDIDKVTYGNVTQTISGSGTLTPVTKKTLTSLQGGVVEEVNFVAGDEVAENDVLAIINGEEIVAPFDGVLLEFPLSVGTEVAKGGSVAMIMGKDGFTMGIAVDETEISSISLGQEVTFKITAVNEECSGEVTAISYNGSSNGGSVAFQITVTAEYVEGVYPGMSVSAQIVIEDSGEGLLVPADTVYTSGDRKYVYLAPAGTRYGESYEEGEIDTSKFNKVYVTTGMSDGTYIIIESDDLEEGDLIVKTTVTSTLTGSESSGSSGNGFGGQGMFPGGGMNFGDFDFGNFDPGQFPGGMGGFPGFGG